MALDKKRSCSRVTWPLSLSLSMCLSLSLCLLVCVWSSADEIHHCMAELLGISLSPEKSSWSPSREESGLNENTFMHKQQVHCATAKALGKENANKYKRDVVGFVHILIATIPSTCVDSHRNQVRTSRMSLGLTPVSSPGYLRGWLTSKFLYAFLFLDLERKVWDMRMHLGGLSSIFHNISVLNGLQLARICGNFMAESQNTEPVLNSRDFAAQKCSPKKSTPSLKAPLVAITEDKSHTTSIQDWKNWPDPV